MAKVSQAGASKASDETLRVRLTDTQEQLANNEKSMQALREDCAELRKRLADQEQREKILTEALVSIVVSHDGSTITKFSHPHKTGVQFMHTGYCHVCAAADPHMVPHAMPVKRLGKPAITYTDSRDCHVISGCSSEAI
jgi:hypothetical protein